MRLNIRPTIFSAALIFVFARPAAGQNFIPGLGTSDISDLVGGNDRDHNTAYEILQFLENYVPLGTELVLESPGRLYKGRRTDHTVPIEVYEAKPKAPDQPPESQLIDQRIWDVSSPDRIGKGAAKPTQLARGLALMLDLIRQQTHSKMKDLRVTLDTPEHLGHPVRATGSSEAEIRIEQPEKILQSPSEVTSAGQQPSDEPISNAKKTEPYLQYRVHLFQGRNMTHTGSAIYHLPQGEKEAFVKQQLEPEPSSTKRLRQWVKRKAKIKAPH